MGGFVIRSASKTSETKPSRLLMFTQSLSARIITSRLLWLFLLFFVGHSSCSATLVLTACSRDGVIIAADGLSLKPGGNPPTVQSCKIMQGTDSCFFSIVGVQDINSIHYDLVPIARRFCRGNGSIVERAKAFEKNTLPEIRRAWNHIKAHEPAAYALMKRSGSARVSVVFAGGPPFTVVIVQYVEDFSGNMTIDNSMIDVSNLASQTAYETVGASENVEVYQRQHPEIGRLNDADFLRSLLLGTIQLEHDPKRIGSPIAILEVKNTGASWIEQGACPKINHHSQNNPSKKPVMPKTAHN
jgi:hypothetical protein